MPKHLFSSWMSVLPVFCLVFTNCVNTHHRVWGSSQLQSSPVAPTQKLSSIQIGRTTKEEIVRRFGDPTAQRISKAEGAPIESLSYVDSELEIRPYQYLPLLGAMRFVGPLYRQTPSMAMSFSPKEKVSGLTVSTLNAYGDIRASKRFTGAHSRTSFYGMNNPEVSYLPTRD